MLYVNINFFITYTLSNILAYNCSCSLWSFIFLWYHLIACFLFLILFESSLFFFIILAKWFLISCAFKEPGLLFIIFLLAFSFLFYLFLLWSSFLSFYLFCFLFVLSFYNFSSCKVRLFILYFLASWGRYLPLLTFLL